MENNNIFQRVEKKYLLPQDTYEELLNRIEPYMQLDKFGRYTICNIYYDTDTFDLIRNSIEGPKYKEKLRLRSYGIPEANDKVYLELKKKYKGTVYKRRISMKLSEAENYLENGVKPIKDSQILHEIDYFIQFYQPKGKLYLAYDRRAYFGKEDSCIRITFDNNIRSRYNDLDLALGDYGTQTLEQGLYLMEIKVSQALPFWLARTLSELSIFPTSFSKYGTIYKQNMIEERQNELCLPVY